jgi:hypothetical protein
VVRLAPEVHGFLGINQVSALLFEMLAVKSFIAFSAAQHLPSPSRMAPSQKSAYLIVGVALEKKNIDGGQLVDVSVALKLLPDAGPDGGDGVRDRVHGLDFGRLGRQSN